MNSKSLSLKRALVSTDYPNKKIKFIKTDNSDDSDQDDKLDNTKINDNNFITSFIIISPAGFGNSNNPFKLSNNDGDDGEEDDGDDGEEDDGDEEEEDDGEEDGEEDDGDDGEEDGEEEDGEEDDDEEDDSYKPNISNKKNSKLDQIKTKDVEYIGSSDSDDSENELDTSNPKKFAINLLKKVKRHNSKDKPNQIAIKFNNKIKKLNIKYIGYSKNPRAYRKLREYKKNIDECKDLYNLLDDEISFFGKSFNFDIFFKKYDKIKSNKKTYNNSAITSNYNNKPNLLDLLLGNIGNEQFTSKAPNSKLDKEFEELYEKDNKPHQSGFKYFKTLNNELKKHYIDKLKNINKEDESIDKRPNYMRILDMNMCESNKSLILQRISQLENSNYPSSKLKNWINKIMTVPFGSYVKPPVTKSDDTSKIKNYLDGVRKQLDSEIYGHQPTKDQLIKILAHTITNPVEGGNIFALQGPPGVGKTALIQDGIAKALGRPFAFISLGGATDSCFLEGHDYTYEGSNHGRIIEVLQQTKCMNPVIYFDELDKVSETAKGEEIINILMHITDQTQNSHFNDKYFGGINFDLSKAIIIFSFNEEQKVSRILRDRMKIIRVKGYKLFDKVNIARDYLIPKLLKQIGLEDIKINISDKILEYLIDSYTEEGGVRKIKELLNDIFLEINLRKLEGNKILGKKIKSQIILNEEMVEKDFLKKKHKIIHEKINSEPLVGLVNGLWANDLGVGGMLPIECCWVPAKDKLELELTGMQGDVMKESMSVARSVAWRILPEHIKSRLNVKWANSFDNGIHIHCPDGATPKDGPSAGGAITTCLISLLTGSKINNQVAMTGEINLKGHITAIGGLEEKIFGAKKAGVKLVLCPKENSKDLDEIKDKFSTLFDRDFVVKMVENVWEILDEVILDPIEWIRFD